MKKAGNGPFPATVPSAFVSGEASLREEEGLQEEMEWVESISEPTEKGWPPWPIPHVIKTTRSSWSTTTYACLL